jgi:hypothetical protein
MLEGIGIGDNTNRKECNEYVEAFVLAKPNVVALAATSSYKKNIGWFFGIRGAVVPN